jgi:hypothetical protein
LVCDIPAGDGKIANLFFTVYVHCSRLKIDIFSLPYFQLFFSPSFFQGRISGDFFLPEKAKENFFLGFCLLYLYSRKTFGYSTNLCGQMSHF